MMRACQVCEAELDSLSELRDVSTSQRQLTVSLLIVLFLDGCSKYDKHVWSKKVKWIIFNIDGTRKIFQKDLFSFTYDQHVLTYNT